jgi:hypothetical protein
MLRVVFRRIRPEKEAGLRAWLKELMARQDEVREAFVQESVRHEQAFIIQGENGPVLVYAMEAEDHEQARGAFEASTLPIDAEHKKVMRDTLGEALDLEPLYDCFLEQADDAR